MRPTRLLLTKFINNMDYFSNSSNENPLLTEVSSKLNKLKSSEQQLKDELVPLRKMKRELDNSLNKIVKSCLNWEKKQK